MKKRRSVLTFAVVLALAVMLGSCSGAPGNTAQSAKPGDHFTFENLDVTVLQTDGRKVLEIEVKVNPEPEQEQEKEKKYESLLDRRQMTEETWVQIAKQYSQTDAEEMQMRLERDLEAIAAAKQLKKTAEKEIGQNVIPDLEELEKQKARSEELLNKLREQLTECSTRYQTNRS